MDDTEGVCPGKKVENDNWRKEQPQLIAYGFLDTWTPVGEWMIVPNYKNIRIKISPSFLQRDPASGIAHEEIHGVKNFQHQKKEIEKW